MHSKLPKSYTRVIIKLSFDDQQETLRLFLGVVSGTAYAMLIPAGMAAAGDPAHSALQAHFTLQ